MAGPLDLERFVVAQDAVLPDVRRELGAGAKRSHWMWFVFPQLTGLGRSSTARQYGLPDLPAARAYLAHPVLGPRLKDATGLVCRHRGRSAHAIFGSPDNLKFRSCMTLFAQAAPDEPLFREALALFYGGAPDPRTLELLDAPGG